MLFFQIFYQRKGVFAYSTWIVVFALFISSCSGPFLGAGSSVGLAALEERSARQVALDLATTAKIINDNIMIEPTERSMPAVTITMNTPKANIDCQDICLKTLVTFLQDKKTSGCKMCITKIIITNKRRIPYFSKYGISFK